MTTAPDPFDALRADDTPITPPAPVVARVRDLLTTELERLMTDTTPATTTTGRRTVPADLHTVGTVQPYLCVDGAAAAIEFYVDAFGAVEHHRMVGGDGRIGHAEIVIGSSRLMLADEYPEAGVLAPTSRGGTSTNFTLQVTDAAMLDDMFTRALALGASELRPIADQPYGQRQGTLRDPFGHQWSISAPLADFDDSRYDASMRDAGFEVVRPQAPADAAGGHQYKHYDRGDLYYFTLQVPDLARAQRFYAAVLGWEFASPDHGHATNIAAPPGGVQQVDDPAGPQLWFVVDDIHVAVAAVRAAGGTADEPVFYESGWSADCTDDQGTRFSLSVPTYTR
ncbi:MAG: VOC family protein [Acidimicrobiales bacterium]|nr:VOC family protein [Acidimicrobiales bacterium]MCB9395139.1 VOC family protein [Acidimicrobiaceae bacterium]